MPIPHIIFVVRTMSVEPNISCGAILLHMEICDGHVEQNCFTSQATLLYVTKLPVVWSNFVMWSNDKMLHIPNVAPCDKFTMYAVLTQYRFCCDLRTFVWSKKEVNIPVCRAKWTNMMYGSSRPHRRGLRGGPLEVSPHCNGQPSSPKVSNPTNMDMGMIGLPNLYEFLENFRSQSHIS